MSSHKMKQFSYSQLIFDRELRSGLSMSFILLLLSAMHSVKFLSEIRKPESLILDKKTGKFYLGLENQKVSYWIRKPKVSSWIKKQKVLSA